MKARTAAAIGSVLALAGAALAAAAFGSTTTAQKLKITERDYTLAFTPRSMAPGSVTFVVHNAGRVAHALAVSGPGLATVRTTSIAPGATRTLRVTLGQGTFKLWCPLGRHAASGMKMTLRVGAAPVVPPPATTTNGGYGGGDDGY
jgi:plastocyanin